MVSYRFKKLSLLMEFIEQPVQVGPGTNDPVLAEPLKFLHITIQDKVESFSKIMMFQCMQKQGRVCPEIILGSTITHMKITEYDPFRIVFNIDPDRIFKKLIQVSENQPVPFYARH
jgi:hypothetical protein